MKRVAVIGAGAAGLAALRSLTRCSGMHVIAYEQSDKVGGTWVHNDKYKPTSMYDNLRTNLPKEMMAFPGFPFANSIRTSFIKHGEVLDYLENFAKHYHLHQHIEFLTKVISVRCSENKLWEVTVQSGTEATLSTGLFDAVVVCNGHYTVPSIPELPGADIFNGEILHSHFYRRPEPYRNKIVLILGAGPSGVDIALDIAPLATMVYLSHNKAEMLSILPECVKQVSGLTGFTEKEAVLKNGKKIIVDKVILATGYEFVFPFLSKECQPLIKNRRMISLYKTIVEVNYPSLFYIGLNQKIAPFPQFHMQAEFISAILNEKIKLPSKKYMLKAIDDDYQQNTVAKGKLERYHHFQGDYQWDYNLSLAIDSQVEPLPAYTKKLYSHVSNHRHRDVQNYKNVNYAITESGEDFEQLQS